MSSVTQKNPIRLFVSHVWHDDDDYHRVFEYLESVDNFFYRNTSTPDKRPQGDKDALRNDLRHQALKRCGDRFVRLEVYQRLDAVSLGKTLGQALTVFVDTPHQIVGHADIQRSTGVYWRECIPNRPFF